MAFDPHRRSLQFFTMISRLLALLALLHISSVDSEIMLDLNGEWLVWSGKKGRNVIDHRWVFSLQLFKKTCLLRLVIQVLLSQPVVGLLMPNLPAL